MEKISDKRPICKFFIQGYCKYQNKCHNSHPKKNPKACFDFQEKGFCKYGSKCNFFHNSKKKVPEKFYPDFSPQKFFEKNENENSSKVNETNQNEKTFPLEIKTKENILFEESKISKTQFNDLKIEERKEEKNVNLKHKPFIDFSKTQLGQMIFEKNKDLWGSEISYFDHLKTLKIEKDIEICQLQRKYKSSFMWISDIERDQDVQMKAFQIRHTPTIRREFLEIDFEIEEGYLWFEFVLHWDEYPDNDSIRIHLINNSIPNSFKKAFVIYFKKNFIETKSIFKTLRNIDNSFDKICHDFAIRKCQKEDIWTQEQQLSLEKAILKYRTITDIAEKWKAIALDVPEKDSDACIKRFKECRDKAISAKKNEEQKIATDSETSNESEEETEEITEDNYQKDEDRNSQTSEENEEEIIENKKEKALENEYNVDMNLLIKVNDLKLKQIGVINVEEVAFLAKCQKCKEETEKKLMPHPNFNDYLYNDILCANCNTSGIILLKKAFLHTKSDILGKAGSNSWDLLDVLTVNLNVSCEQCDHYKIVTKYIVGTNVIYNCFSCFQEANFSFASYSLSYEEYSENHKKILRKIDKNLPKEAIIFKKIKKIGNYKLDQPLPSNGNCKHYKHSYRYFRFPCCGKCDPCDDCHLEKEKHEMILAKTMICGFCSYEQPIKDQCMRCGKILTRQTILGGRHWEGGKGCRNKTFMSKKDPHKFSGLSKTTSKKKTQK